ncbi:kelch repeat-containing protein [Sorangium sp. So ce134]
MSVRFPSRGSRFALSTWLTALLVGALSLTGLGCAPDAAPPAGDDLRLRFPEQAAQVLEGSEAFVAVDGGFALASTRDSVREIDALFERRGGLHAALPASGEGKVRFHLPGGFEIGVREIGAEGEGAVVERAVAYRREGGRSFWSVVGEGYEEWLLLEAGVAHGDAPVAAWEVDGATLRQQGDAVEVVDDAGAAQLRVTAPAAYASGGRPVAPRLEVRGARIELWVDADGEAVLVDPVWAPAGTMSAARANYTATKLGNGQVLVVGGYNGSAVATAERYDPVSNTWVSAGTLATARQNHTATLLGNGKVLIAGGVNYSSGVYANAELYDPTTNTWSATGALVTARHLHSATLLGNGKVLVAGGYGPSSTYLASAELYDPASGTWSSPSSMSMATSRAGHAAALLGSGKVFVAGGRNGSYLTSAEIYDPATNTWTPTLSMAASRYLATATLLGNGKVLIAGGYDNPFGERQSAEIYDPNPASPSWTTVASMSSKRTGHTATLLPNGKVLVTGGSSAALTGNSSAEAYDPGTNTWAAVESMSSVRIDHTATLLNNGKVLIAGGYRPTSTSTTYLSSAELHDPAAGTWQPVAPMSNGRIAPTATLLNDGRVLVTGGDSSGSSSELYNPATDTWAAGPPMGPARQYHTATLLGNGKVLVVGVRTFVSSANAELFDPATDTWSSVGSSSNPNLDRKGHTATLLPNGKVLVVGGVQVAAFPTTYLRTAALFNPATNSWSSAASLPNLASAPRAYHAATLLPDGTVLISGGTNATGTLGSSYIYHPTADSWALVDSMVSNRAYHTLTLLGNGDVLATGGQTSGRLYERYYPAFDSWSGGPYFSTLHADTATLLSNGKVLMAAGQDGSGNAERSVRIYDPVTDTLALTGELNDARYAHAAVRLGNGKVLVVGGSDGSALSSAEIYTP